MISKNKKIKVRAFSNSQLAISVVPISEFTHTKRNTAVNIINQGFFIKGVLVFDIAIVKVINLLNLFPFSYEI